MFIISCKDKELLNSPNPIAGIYCITSPTGKKYVGQSWDIKRSRLYQYQKLHCKDQPKLLNSLVKYGVETHIFEIYVHYKLNHQIVLDSLERYVWGSFVLQGVEMLNLREPDGSRGKMSAESRFKMKVARTGKAHSDETKRKIRDGNLGRVISVDARKRISEAHKLLHENKEYRDKVSKGFFKKGVSKKLSETHKANISKAKKGVGLGKNLSEETKHKIAAKNKGKKLSAEHIEKLRLINKGRVMSEETKMKLSANRKRIPIVQYSLNYDFIKKWDGINLASKQLGIHNYCISECLRGKFRTAGGFIWRYEEEVNNNTARPLDYIGKTRNLSNTKLTESDAKEVKRQLSLGVKQSIIAKQFNVSSTPIFKIKHGLQWAHVKFD